MTSHRKITTYRLRKQCRLFSESSALVPSQQLKLNDLLSAGTLGERGRGGDDEVLL